ncbi:unnamed protein product [Ilex paraguariensis]|uniref:Uncharacterized protein n=1 Tax=Ilex paraguariensis TaxID=185542 RepID=A0ABC8TUU9_9AQUA
MSNIHFAITHTHSDDCKSIFVNIFSLLFLSFRVPRLLAQFGCFLRLAKAQFLSESYLSLNKLACPDCHEATCGVATAEDGGWAAGVCQVCSYTAQEIH